MYSYEKLRIENNTRDVIIYIFRHVPFLTHLTYPVRIITYIRKEWRRLQTRRKRLSEQLLPRSVNIS